MRNYREQQPVMDDPKETQEETPAAETPGEGAALANGAEEGQE